MKDATVCFFTVCGGGEEYEFLLGSIRHHAEMGLHLVLDTAPAERAKKFVNLPKTVRWVHEPKFGYGWKSFKLRSAVERAMNLAREMRTKVLVYLDCDEFFSGECATWAFRLAVDRAVDFKTYAWKEDLLPYDCGDSEWHRRAWPASAGVNIIKNGSWIESPHYNGNPEHHPIPSIPPSLSHIRANGDLHHHLHYAIGKKSKNLETAVTTIPGWKDATHIYPTPWPELLAAWRDQGTLPSASFL